MINTRNGKRTNMKMLKKDFKNHKMWGRKVRKCRFFFFFFFFFTMCLRPYDYQAKASTSRHRKKLTYLKNRAT